MSASIYTANRNIVTDQGLRYAPLLPISWPTSPANIDTAETIACLRRHTHSFGQTLIVIGWGNGSALDLILQDDLLRSRVVHVFVMPEEAEAFAYSLGHEAFRNISSLANVQIHLVNDDADLHSTLQSQYTSHAAIATLAGVIFIDDIPVVDAAEERQQRWSVQLKESIAKLYDSLGNDVFDTYMGARHAMEHGDLLVTLPRSSDYAGLYTGASAIVIASGPSAAGHFEQIRVIQDEHIIIVADSILKACYDNGIDPDFVAIVERPPEMVKLFEGQPERSSKTRLLTLPVVHQSVVTPYADDDRLVWWWAPDMLYPWIDAEEPRRNSGRSTGTLGVAAAHMLGCSTAYLVGHDLALSGTDTHADQVHDFTKEEQAKANSRYSRDNPNYQYRIIDVPGNGTTTVETTGVWNIFKSDIEAIIRTSPGTTFVNINAETGVGAAIHGTVAGQLPEPSGERLERHWPQRSYDESDVAIFRERRTAIGPLLETITTTLQEAADEINGWSPLVATREDIDRIAGQIDIAKLSGDDNQWWFRYVFRAALHNLQLKMHYNSHVRTRLELDWNQTQVMRIYAESMVQLITAMRPELPTETADVVTEHS